MATAVAFVLSLLFAAPTQASAAVAAAGSTTTTVAVAPTFVLRAPTTVRAHVDAAGVPATGVVHFEQQTAAGWTVVAESTLDAAGDAAASVTFGSGPVTLRASYLGADGLEPSQSAPATTTGVPQQATIVLAAPRSVVDETTLRVSARVQTPYGPVAGETVSFQVYRDRRWRTYATATTDAAGRTTARSRPRATFQHRATVSATDWHTASKTATVVIRNTPPGTVVRLPKGAPRPSRRLPAQPRATRAGADAVVSSIGDAVWKTMKGRSWRSGCPVGRSQLRIVRVNYWGFDGYRHRGEIVVHRSIAAKTARAFTDLHRNEVSIRSMYRPDRFGYSRRVRGADDYASMEADNTSGFNCRSVVGRPGVRSPHATGRAIDINPFENPYRYRAGRWVPNSWWSRHAAGTYAWTKKSHLVPTIMRRHGFRWTYGNIDAQHFDG